MGCQRVLAMIVGVALLQSLALADKTNITIYNHGIGLVSESRSMEFSKGIQDLHFEGVSQMIEPSSVLFDAEGVALLEQNYEYDLVDGNALLKRFLDQSITVTLKDSGELIAGRLLSFGGDLVLETNDGIVSLSRGSWTGIRYPELPEGLRTRPALKWLLNAKRAGTRQVDVTYTTGGLGWSAEYVCLLNADDSSMNLASWVNLHNNTGMSWDNAGLQLVAGDLHQANTNGPPRYERMTMAADAVKMDVGFSEESFFEYHLYTLPRKVDLGNNQDKEISLFDPVETRIEKIYVYDANRNRDGVQTKLRFKNTKGEGPGQAMPEGKVRLYKMDSKGHRQLIGEDHIQHTPRDEEVELTAGKAFDLVVERVQKDHRKFGRGYENDIELTVRNRKDKEAVTILLDEHAWGDWEIVRSTHSTKKLNANTARITVSLEAGEEEVVRITLRGNR